jgi:hypothetical protein
MSQNAHTNLPLKSFILLKAAPPIEVRLYNHLPLHPAEIYTIQSPRHPPSLLLNRIKPSAGLASMPSGGLAVPKKEAGHSPCEGPKPTSKLDGVISAFFCYLWQTN